MCDKLHALFLIWIDNTQKFGEQRHETRIDEMSLSFSSESVINRPQGQWFRVESSNVLHALRTCVAAVLAEFGNFSRPSEVQRSLTLDKTLSRQIFKLACTAEPLGTGSVLPSRTSVGRFLEVARERGVSNEKVEQVWRAYEVFEKLIETHAGDRATFNSMISAATGVDDEWLAADLQHRRNAFRAMSHTMGVQAKTKLQLAVVNDIEDGGAYTVAMVSGLIGLRVLREVPRVRVDGIALGPAKETRGSTCVPLGISESLGGYLLESFSSKPLPALRVSQHEDEEGQWREVFIDEPQIGNTGASTLLFGSLYPRVPVGKDPLGIHVTTNKPVEILLFDVLTKPGLLGGAKAVGKAMLGYNEKFGGEVFPLEGKFGAELLGNGPAALATPEVPRYAEMIQAISEKLGWKLEEYNAWRIRVEYPLYQGTVTMSWTRPENAAGGSSKS
jgi:hypothetical protein